MRRRRVLAAHVQRIGIGFLYEEDPAVHERIPLPDLLHDAAVFRAYLFDLAVRRRRLFVEYGEPALFAQGGSPEGELVFVDAAVRGEEEYARRGGDIGGDAVERPYRLGEISLREMFFRLFEFSVDDRRPDVDDFILSVDADDEFLFLFVQAADELVRVDLLDIALYLYVEDVEHGRMAVGAFKLGGFRRVLLQNAAAVRTLHIDERHKISFFRFFRYM